MDTKILDEILFEIDQRGNYLTHKSTPANHERAVKRLERLKFIYEKNQNCFDLTKKGVEAVDLGGFDNWNKHHDSKKHKEDEITELTIKKLKGNIFHLKYWWVILILSGVVAFLTGNFELIINWFSN